MATKKSKKNNALAALFRGLGNVASAFDAAAQTRKDRPQTQSTAMAGVQPAASTPASSDCGGCK